MFLASRSKASSTALLPSALGWRRSALLRGRQRLCGHGLRPSNALCEEEDHHGLVAQLYRLVERSALVAVQLFVHQSFGHVVLQQKVQTQQVALARRGKQLRSQRSAAVGALAAHEVSGEPASFATCCRPAVGATSLCHVTGTAQL